jgi:hypothetical protein
MDKSAEEKELVVNINYEMFVLALVVLSLVNWVLIFVGRLDPAQAQVVWIMNAGLSVFLLLDFAYRVWRHPHGELVKRCRLFRGDNFRSRPRIDRIVRDIG